MDALYFAVFNILVVVVILMATRKNPPPGVPRIDLFDLDDPQR